MAGRPLIFDLPRCGEWATALLAANAATGQLLLALVLSGDALDLVVPPVPVRTQQVSRPAIDRLVVALLAIVIAGDVLDLIESLVLGTDRVKGPLQGPQRGRLGRGRQGGEACRTCHGRQLQRVPPGHLP